MADGRTLESDAAYTAGLDGWFRWGRWSAHFFVEGRQLCNFAHLFLRPSGPTTPKPAELSAHGVPFGRVCSRCLKLAKETRRVA